MSEHAPSKVIRIARIAIPLVCLIGIGFAATSLYNHTAIIYGLNVGPSFCNISEHINCDVVSASQYSTLFGIPIDALGLAFYIIWFVLSLVNMKGAVFSERSFHAALLVFSLLASIISVALFFVSEFLVGALCVLCLGMHFANFSLFAIAVALNEGEGFFTRLRSGIVAVLLIPHALIFGSGRKLAAWLLTVLLGALTYFVLISPPHLAALISERSPAKLQIEEVIKIAINDWTNQIAVDIPFQDSGGVIKDYSRGSPFAPLRLVEFSDFECPACRNFYFPLEDLLKEYGDKVHFVFRNYPIDRACNSELDRDVHRSACLAAHFARCAGEQGKFWEVTDYLFRLPELDDPADKAQTDQAILGASKQLNLDQSALEDCLKSGRQMQRIQQDLLEGSKLGLTGTPSLWLNGKKVKVPNAIILKQLFDTALADSNGTKNP